MRDVTTRNFGLLIAYVLPGFTALWGLSYFSPTIQGWLGAASLDSPTVGGFLYVTLGSVGAGMTVSTIRWLVIDPIHHRTGIRQPDWDFSRLRDTVAAFDALIEIHYRFFQFYANTSISLVITFMLRWLAIGFRPLELLLVLATCGLFFLGSRDTLRKYYERVGGLLGTKASSPSITESGNQIPHRDSQRFGEPFNVDE